MRSPGQGTHPGAQRTGERVAQQIVDVVILTRDAGLLATLRDACGVEHALWPAESADAAVDLLVGGRCGILIADLATLPGDAAGLLDRLRGQFPELVVIAVGKREDEYAVARLVTDGRIYRFLHKPVSPARAGLFINTATRRYGESRDVESLAMATVRQLAVRRSWGKPAAAAMVLIGALTAFLIWRAQLSPETSRQTALTEADQAPGQDVAGVLDLAQRAFDAGRLTAPAGDNALEHYRAALAIQPQNAAAAAGVERIAREMQRQAEQALARGDLPQAVNALTALQQANPSHRELERLRSELLALSRAPRPATPATVPPPGPAEPRTPVQDATAAQRTQRLAAVRARIAGDQLREPQDDSALYHLQEARALGENDPAVRIVATELGTSLLGKAQQAIAAGELSAARNSLEAAAALDTELGLALSDVESIHRQLDAALASTERAGWSERLAHARRLRESGQLIEPASGNAYDEITALRASAPASNELRSEEQRLTFALLEHARTALAGNDPERALVLARRADTLVPGMGNTRALLDQASAALDMRSFMTNVIPATDLKRVRQVPASYPREAERAGIQGWVDVEFTVAPDGTPQEFVVREAQPKEIFDKAAVDSVRQWRFEPVVRNGAAVPQRAVLRVRFVLQ